MGRIMILDVDCQVREHCEQSRVILDQLADSPQVPVSMQDVQSQLRDERAVRGNLMDDTDEQLQRERRESWRLVLPELAQSPQPPALQHVQFGAALNVTESLMSGRIVVPLFRLGRREPCVKCRALIFKHEKKWGHLCCMKGQVGSSTSSGAARGA